MQQVGGLAHWTYADRERDPPPHGFGLCKGFSLSKESVCERATPPELLIGPLPPPDGAAGSEGAAGATAAEGLLVNGLVFPRTASM